VQQCLHQETDAVIHDVCKQETVVSDALTHYQLQMFCQNTRLAFLARNMATPLISDSLARVDASVLGALCKKGTHTSHGNWTQDYCHLAEIKLRFPRFRDVLFDITPNAASAICALLSQAVCKWMGDPLDSHHQYLDLSRIWAPPQLPPVLVHDAVCQEWGSMAVVSAHAPRQINLGAPVPELGAAVHSQVELEGVALSVMDAAAMDLDEDDMMIDTDDMMTFGTLLPPQQEQAWNLIASSALPSSNYHHTAQACDAYALLRRGVNTGVNTAANTAATTDVNRGVNRGVNTGINCVSYHPWSYDDTACDDSAIVPSLRLSEILDDGACAVLDHGACDPEPTGEWSNFSSMTLENSNILQGAAQVGEEGQVVSDCVLPPLPLWAGLLGGPAKPMTPAGLLTPTMILQTVADSQDKVFVHVHVCVRACVRACVRVRVRVRVRVHACGCVCKIARFPTHICMQLCQQSKPQQAQTKHPTLPARLYSFLRLPRTFLLPAFPTRHLAALHAPSRARFRPQIISAVP